MQHSNWMKTTRWGVLFLVVAGCGSTGTPATSGEASPRATTELPGTEKPEMPPPSRLIPATLDPAVRAKATQLLGNGVDREKAAAEFRKMRLEAIPYLLEIYLGPDNMPRPEVAPILGDIWMIRGLFGSSFDPKATEMLLEGVTHANPTLRRGAVTGLFFAMQDDRQRERILAGLTTCHKTDQDPLVRSQASKILGFIATDIVGNHMLSPDTTLTEKVRKMDAHFQTLERIGEPALNILEKGLDGTQASLDDIAQLERIRRGIGAATPNPEVAEAVRYMFAWQAGARKTIETIRASDKK